jgi:hypothetical protein
METQQIKPTKITFSILELVFVSSWIGIVAVFLTMIMMYALYIEPLKEKAVEEGYAEWVVTNNKTGETKFTWKNDQ